MPDPLVGDHLAGGYFVVRSSAGSPPWIPGRLGVTRAMSVSAELVPMFPTPTWVTDFEILAAAFGLAPGDRAAAGQWADDLIAAGGFGWPNVFFDVRDAHAFRERFASKRDDVAVIGVGILGAHAEGFATDVDAGLRRLTVGVGVGGEGVSELLDRRERLADGGRALGYELLGMDVPPLTSWAVNDLPVLVHDRLGISVNEDGLIVSWDDACRAADFVSGPDVPSEPLNWRPWLVVDYS